jgi:site-specific recombinase
LDREINWIEKQALNLANKSENIEGLRRINQQISGMVGIQMIVFAILGIAVIGAVNVIFFWLVKGELKRRKLIWSNIKLLSINT